jgi:A/G-specific adenine glycosylase
MSTFSERLVSWQRLSGRHDLPWQNTTDPYRVWVSEIMLQQTQVSSVIVYYQRFMEAFPSVEHLACATEEDVLARWAGLGYYSRGRNLHRAAQQIMKEWRGVFSALPEDWMALPGVGRSTAAAITSFCFKARVAILDGNVKRVLCRHVGVVGFPGERLVEKKLWEEAQRLLPLDENDMPAYTQGIMDLGASLCKRKNPECGQCPVAQDCSAHRLGCENDFPAPRPKKIIPERWLNMVVVIQNNHILLEYRTRPGVWKGLWSLPEFSDPFDESMLSTTIKKWGMDVMDMNRKTPFQHVFSHYKLHLFPWVVYAKVSGGVPLLEGLVWKHLDELNVLGLPAPVRKFLDGMSLSSQRLSQP